MTLETTPGEGEAMLTESVGTRAERIRVCLDRVAAGQLQDGLQGLLALVKADPTDPHALHAVGLAALHGGDAQRAEQFVARALEQALARDEHVLAAALRADLLDILAAAARLCDAASKLSDAEALYRRIARLDPTNVGAWRRLTAIGLAHGDIEASTAALRELSRLVPDDPDALTAEAELEYLNGFAQDYRDAYDRRAIRLLERALEGAPGHRDAGLLLGVLLNGCGDRAKAIEVLARSASANASAIPVRFELGRLLAQAGRSDEAFRVLTEAESLRAAENAIRQPIVDLSISGRRDEAHAAIDERLRADPNNLHAVYLRAIVLEHHRRPGDAAYWFSRVFDLDASQLTASARWAFRLGQLGASDASVNVLRRVLLRWPDFSVARIQSALALPPIYPDLRTLEAKRRGYTEGLARLRRDPPRFGSEDTQLLSANFWLGYQGRNDRELQVALAAMYAKSSPDLAYVAPHVARRTNRPRLRIGLLSAFFSDHVTTRMYRGLIEHLDRKRFEVVLIHTSDGVRDAVSGEVDALADGSVYLPSGMAASRAALAQLELDVLFFPDIGMSHDNYFLAFGRYARVQCTSWGHPITSGLPSIDYYVSSRRLETAQADAHYSERLVRFDNLPTYYHRPRAVPAYDRTKLGMSADTRLYACLQSLFKFHPDFDAALAGVLRADPKAIVLTLAGSRDTWPSLLRTRWSKLMPDCMDRIRTIPHVDNDTYLGLLRAADVLLDTFPFAGGNTTYQAIAVGAPLVTLPGELLRGRCSLGAYDQIGFHGLVARDTAHYVELAVRAASDRDFRSQCQAAIAAGAPQLFETMEAVEEFNEFFAAAYAASGSEGPRA